MDDKDRSVLQDVEEGPLENTINSPRFYNLSVEETMDQGQGLGSYNDGGPGHGIVFSPDGNEGYLTTALMSDDARSVATSDGGPLTDRLHVIHKYLTV